MVARFLGEEGAKEMRWCAKGSVIVSNDLEGLMSCCECVLVSWDFICWYNLWVSEKGYNREIELENKCTEKNI